MLTKIDETILGYIYEPISWRIEWWTGFHRFAQARGTLLIYVVTRFIDYRLFVDLGKQSSGLIIIACGLIVCTSMYHRSLLIQNLNKRGGLNPDRVAGRLARMIWLSMFALSWFDLSVFLGWLSGTSALYLMACSAPPARPVREMKWRPQEAAT